MADVLSAICSQAFYDAYTGDKARFVARYDGLAAWELARRKDLRAAECREVAVVLEGFTEDLAEPLKFETTWKTAPLYYPLITAEGAARAGSAWNDQAYTLRGNFSTSACIIQKGANAGHLCVAGIQIYNQSVNDVFNCTTVMTDAGVQSHKIKNCWIRGGGRSGLYHWAGVLEVDQCVFIDNCGNNTTYGALAVNAVAGVAGWPVKINNSVIVSNSAMGICNRTQSDIVVNNTYVHVKNGTAGCFGTTNTGGFILNNCASSDATANSFTGANNLINIPYNTEAFRNITTPDITLGDESLLKDAAKNLFNPKTFDVSSVIRRTASVTTGCVLELINGATYANVRYYLFGLGTQDEYAELFSAISLPNPFTGPTQKVGICSDIHLPETNTSLHFTYVRDGFASLGCTTALALGDIVTDDPTGYPTYSAIIAGNGSITWYAIAGNHDEYNAAVDGGEGFEYHTGHSREYYVDIGNCRFYMLGVSESVGDARFGVHADALGLLTAIDPAYNNIVCTHLPLPGTALNSRDVTVGRFLLNWNAFNKSAVNRPIAAFFCGHTHSSTYALGPSVLSISSEADDLLEDISGVNARTVEGDWSIGAMEYPSTADDTAPVLTSPTATATSATTATATVTTDTAGGTIYGVLSESATGMEAADIKSGADDSAEVTDAGDYTLGETGMATWTQYYWHSVHEDGAGLMSNVLTIPVRTLDISIPLDFPDTAPATLLTVQVWSKVPKRADVEGLYGA